MQEPAPPSPTWPGLPPGLAEDLARFDPAAVRRALDRAVVEAAGEFADGIKAYRHHPYRRAGEETRVVWRSGGTTLLDHGAAGVPALFVPSLINRGWVLDLVPGEGMLSWLAQNGVHPYRVEWGAPGAVERAFTIADYIRLRLEPALEEVARRSGRRPVLVGYCMGGLLALAAAVRRPELIAGLVLLAAPWDFHAEGSARGEALGALFRACRATLGLVGELPVELIQGLFAMQDPIVALRKFRRFASLDPDSSEARNFVALEDWLNDGVALSLPVADEALLDWYEANVTGRGAWMVADGVIDPAGVTCPTLVVVPGSDRLVPPASAAAVLPGLRRGTRLDLPLGHIGMVVGSKARSGLWSPLAQWIGASA